MSAPTGDGGAAAVLCSEEFVKKHNLQVGTMAVMVSRLVLKSVARQQ